MPVSVRFIPVPPPAEGPLLFFSADGPAVWRMDPSGNADAASFPGQYCWRL